MANSSIVRISNKTKEIIEELAKKSGEPMLYVIDKAIEEYRRRLILEETNSAYTKLRENEKASKEYDQEIALYDATLMDGIDNSETWEDSRKQSAGKKGRAKQ